MKYYFKHKWFNDLEAAKKASADSGKKIVAIVHKTWYVTTFKSNKKY